MNEDLKELLDERTVLQAENVAQMARLHTAVLALQQTQAAVRNAVSKSREARASWLPGSAER